jgi:cytoskeletal protein CcmA (bactofilin family)
MNEESGRTVEARSHLGPSILIKGNIEGSEDLIIDGQVEGDVTLRGCRLVVSPSARLKGNINAGEIVLEGSVEGNLTATGRITVKARASLVGDITASRVAIEDGARFKGTIKIVSG